MDRRTGKVAPAAPSGSTDLKPAKATAAAPVFMNSRRSREESIGKMVGAVGFEPTTFWSQTRRATKLRYAPITGGEISHNVGLTQRESGRHERHENLAGRQPAVWLELLRYVNRSPRSTAEN